MLNNYALSSCQNNNLFYAGTLGPNNLIYVETTGLNKHWFNSKQELQYQEPYLPENAHV
jgi:hypothetical protein